MSKKIEMVVHTCQDCPHLRCDPYSDIGVSDGYYCSKTGKRITTIGRMDVYEETLIEIRESQGTLFPMTGPLPEYPLTIPDWCPLDDN